MNKNDINKDITSTERWIYLDICKIIAIFLVVVMHVVSGSWGVVPMGSGDWHTINVWNVFSRFGIPLFFMLTGAIFLNEKKEVTVKKLYSRYLFRIVTAFLFWSFINMMIYYLQRSPNGFSDFTLGSFLSGFLEGAPYVNVFIFLSMSLYLLFPVLRAIGRDRNACRYFLVLWGIFAVVIPAVKQIPYIFGAMPHSVQQQLWLMWER